VIRLVNCRFGPTSENKKVQYSVYWYVRVEMSTSYPNIDIFDIWKLIKAETFYKYYINIQFRDAFEQFWKLM
jgi:hypothetical protein